MRYVNEKVSFSVCSCGRRTVLCGGHCFPPKQQPGNFPPGVTAPKKTSPDHRLASAQAANPDTVAWITIPGTNIDGPVQQADDNEYYLRRNSLGENDHEGCLYADFECDLSTAEALSTNTIIYGHSFTAPDKSLILVSASCVSTWKMILPKNTRIFFFLFRIRNCTFPSFLWGWPTQQKIRSVFWLIQLPVSFRL